MKIGIDATVWNNQRGYGRHARALFKSLVMLDADNQYTFVTDNTEIPPDFPAGARIIQVKAHRPTTVAAAADSRRSMIDMWRMSSALSGREFDMLIFPTVYSYVPVKSRARKVLFIHDIIPEKYPDLTLPSWSARNFWRAKSFIGRWQADMIVTVSEYSRQAIIEYFKLDPEKVRVVGEANDPIFRRLVDPEISPFRWAVDSGQNSRKIVYLGGFGPHKNVAMLVEEFARLIERGEYPDARLILVGEYKKETFFSSVGILRSKIDELGIADRVLFTGYLSEEELVQLLNTATVLVLPSFMEGFGLPAIEAAACGCPVIATTASPLPAILGESALYFDPNQPQELEERLVRVLDSVELRDKMRESGIKAVRALSWEDAAREMKALIDQVGHD